MNGKKISLVLCLSFAMLLAGGLLAESALAEDPQPDATVAISGKSVAIGVGWSWGDGTFKYQGKELTFSVKGLSLIDLGISSADAVGTVTNLKTPSDFAGTYRAVKGVIALGGGVGSSSMVNQKGVKLNLRGTVKGLKFALALTGVKIAFDQGQLAKLAEVEHLGPKINKSLSALTNVCGCPLIINVAWETYDTQKTKRNVGYTIDAFVSAATEYCETDLKKKAFCENVEQLDVVFNDKEVTKTLSNGNTIIVTSTERGHISVEEFVSFLATL